MSFTGYSVFQASQITDSTARLDAAELAIEHNLSTAIAKYTLLDAKDVQHDEYISTLTGVKVDLSVYDAKMALVDAKDAEQDGRLVAVENRATALEGDISSRVQAEIDSKVSQVVFDTIHTELMDVDSQLTSTLATKVAATVQTQLDDSQNSTIATKLAIEDFETFVSTATVELDLKAEQSDLLLYINSNNNLVSTKAAQIDLLNLSTGVGQRVGARVTLAQYNAEVSTLNIRLDSMDANTNSRVTFSQYTSEQNAQNSTISSKVGMIQYIAERDIQDAAIGTKLATATYTSDKAVQDALVASKVAQTDYDAYVSLNNTAVASKVAQSVYDVNEATQNAAIALKAEQSGLDAYIASNDAVVATKVAQDEFDAVVSTVSYELDLKTDQSQFDAVTSFLNSRTNTYETRFNAVEEFIRALLATYTIMRPDNTLYNYTGQSQGIAVPPPPFSIIGKRRVGTQTWIVGVQLTDYGYNTMLGDVIFAGSFPAIGGGAFGITKAQINGNTKYIELALIGTRISGTDDWNTAVTRPFPVQYRNSQFVPTYSFTFTESFFNGLTLLNDFTPESPTNLAYDAVAKKVTFNVANPNLIDFVDVNIDGTWFQVQDTSTLFSYVNTLVTINLASAPVTPSAQIDVYTRYDKILSLTTGANPASGGFGRITL